MENTNGRFLLRQVFRRLFYSLDFLLIDIEPIIIDYLVLPILAFLNYKSDLTTKGVISGVIKGDELDSDTHFTLRFDNFNRIVSIGRTGSRLESRGSIKRFKRRLHLLIKKTYVVVVHKTKDLLNAFLKKSNIFLTFFTH